MTNCSNSITSVRKGSMFVALLLLLLLWSFTAADEAGKVIPLDKAIAVIEQSEGRIERAQWVFQFLFGRLTDAYDRKTVTFDTDAPFKTSVIIEPISGRYRCDTEGIARWVGGVAPHIGYRRSYSFDSEQQREYVLENPGTKIPKPEQATGFGSITGEHRGEFMSKWGTQSGVWHFPPYSFGVKLSDLLKERLRRKSPLRITEDMQGLWTINTDDNQPLPGVILQIFYDPAKGVVTGARWIDDVTMGKPSTPFKEMYVELTQTENGFWVPQQIDTVNIHDRTIGRMLYSDVKVNQSVDDSIFRFVFPLGTQITDDLEEKRYIIGEGAVNDEAATLAYAQLHGLRLEENAPPPPDAFPLRRILVITTIVLVVVLLLLLLWQWRSKAARRGVSILLMALLPAAADAAELNERGEWVVKYGDNETIRMSQCGMNVTVLTLTCFSIRYDLRQLAEALPPTREGISFADIQTVLQAHGLRCVARQGVSLTDLKEALRPNVMAIFPAPGPGGYNHYLAAINHPRQGCLLLDPPHRPPVPLHEALAEPHLQPLSGLVLFVGRDQQTSPQASRVTLSPLRVCSKSLKPLVLGDVP